MLEKLKRIDKTILLFFLGFIVLRIFLFNFNAAEWGDTYSILRMAEFLRNLRIPVDEKRLPIFSISLIPGFYIANPILWGRLVVLGASFLVLNLSYKIHKILYPKSRRFLLILLLILLNPIFMYWSIRVMADIFFAALALGAIYVNLRKKDEDRVTLVAFLVSLAALTRFEGFLLVPGFLLFYLITKNFKALAAFIVIFSLLVAPWFILTKFILGADTSGAYIREAERFIFDLKRFRFAIISYVFAFGFAPGFLFYVLGLKDFVINNIKKISSFIPLLSFLILETALAFYWTPSVPRILVPIIPLMVIFFVEGLSEFFKQEGPAYQRKIGSLKGVFLLGLSLALILFYLYGQYVERTHFLVLSKSGLVLAASLSLISVSFLIFKNKVLAIRGLLAFLLLTLLISNFVILTNHKNHYLPTLKAAKFAKSRAQDIEGKVSYSDETGVSKWILEQAGVGYKLPKYAVQFDDIHFFLKSNKIDYVLWSNEFEKFSSFWWIVDNERERDNFELIFKDQVDVSDKLDLIVDKYLGTNLVDKHWIQEARVYKYIVEL